MDTTKININGISVKVDSKIVANVHMSQDFCIGDDVHVTVYIYEDNDGIWKMTSWLNGIEELNTEDVDKDVSALSNKEIIAIMEEFIHEHEEYILDVAGWED